MIDRNSLASLLFELRWTGKEAQHRETFLAPRANFWRDLFPERLTQTLVGKSEGDCIELTFPPGEAVPLRRNDYILAMQWSEFRGGYGSPVARPRFGRFYPWGLLKNLAGIFPDDLRPFRVSGTGADGFIADLNHPLSGYSLELSVTVQETQVQKAERGGRVIDWMSEILDQGPGMQARCDGKPTDFNEPGAYQRQDDSEDTLFYTKPRLIGHIDRQANSMLENIYGGILPECGRVLDIMSSVESHLPPRRTWHVTGLGMNREEMAGNAALHHFVVHDLNAHPALPLPDASFASAICSLSVEYLIDPVRVFREAARILVPGAPFAVSFSNRWFPPKTTMLWPSLSEFERVGLVLDYFIRSDCFRDLRTFSARNRPRPSDDSHYPQQRTSDPLYVVWGYRI